MGYVLADAHGWLAHPSHHPPFEAIPLQTFAKLRDAVNDKTADFFMWEYFTSKRYYDNGSIKRIGEIYTPWSSWKIVASDSIPVEDPRLGDLFGKLDQGVKYFEDHQDEAVEWISENLDYSREDAREWLTTVEFAHGVKGVDKEVVEKTMGALKKAGVVSSEGGETGVEDMIGIMRER